MLVLAMWNRKVKKRIKLKIDKRERDKFKIALTKLIRGIIFNSILLLTLYLIFRANFI